jgi:hypothetical protein
MIYITVEFGAKLSIYEQIIASWIVSKFYSLDS